VANNDVYNTFTGIAVFRTRRFIIVGDFVLRRITTVAGGQRNEVGKGERGGEEASDGASVRSFEMPPDRCSELGAYDVEPQ